MDELIKALAPAFAVGLALQALVEWLDNWVVGLVNLLRGMVPGWKKTPTKDAYNQLTVIQQQEEDEEAKKHKKAVIRTISVVLGTLLALSLQIHVLKALNLTIPLGLDFIDLLVSGLVISLGTDGVNQVVKFVEQAKNNQENDADKKDTQTKDFQAKEIQMSGSQAGVAPKKALQP